MSNSQVAALPRRPNLEHLKKQARDLLNLARGGDADAVARLGEVAKRGAASDALTLASALHVVASSYGFASWPLLKRAVLVERAERLRDEALPEDPERRMDLLAEAIDDNDVESVRVLLSRDATLADGWGQRRPLSHAAERDLPSIVDLLIDAGASFEPAGWPHTPLSWAITTGARQAARRLVERGAPVDLWCAAGLGDLQRLGRFVDEQGAPRPDASRHGATRYDATGQALAKPPADAVERLSDALYIACRNGELEAARWLLERGARPGFEGYMGAPALHWAAFSGNGALVRLLLEHGADPEQTDRTHHARYRVFAVRNAIEWAAFDAFERMLRDDASLAHERDAGWGPPLHAAAQRGLAEFVRVLLEAGADPNARDQAGRSVAECAALVTDPHARDRVLARLASSARSP